MSRMENNKHQLATEKYKDLQNLIFQNPDARQYYNELPKNIRDRVKSYSLNIQSLDDLQERSENLRIRGY